MKAYFLLLFLTLQVLSAEGSSSSSPPPPTKPPHIIVIVADDLGWNDVGFHGSNQIPTPNLDALAFSGLQLHSYYVNPICSPSRSALMTGMHPIHTGLQSDVLVGAAPYGLPLRFKLLPEYLNGLGYVSRTVGKWHLGSHRAAFTPTRRGFASHVGYWTGHMDYMDHTAQELYGPVQGWGYDFRRDLNVSWTDYGKYSTDIFTDESVKIIERHNSEDNNSSLFLYLAHQAVHSANTYSPLQAPSDVVDRFAETIVDENRRKFAGILTKLDESVGKVVQALKENHMLKNSVVVFTTDNGGPAAGFNENFASNWPLRGVKDTLWEGGVRGSALLWSPLLASRSRVAKQMMNVQDWLPTLYTAAGGRVRDLPPELDGIDMWRSLSKNEASPRSLFLHNVDDRRRISAVRVGEWKLMKGTTYDGDWDGHYGPSGRGGATPNYDVDAVRSSPAGRALSEIGFGLPKDSEDILRLRREAQLDCGEKALGDPELEPCNLVQQVCLFNITEDPCEMDNLASKYPDVVKIMEDTLDNYRSTAVPPGNKPVDPRGDPKFYDYTWTNWMDVVEPLNATAGHSDREEEEEGGGGLLRKVANMEKKLARWLRKQLGMKFK